MKNIDKKSLKNFGITMCIAFLVISAFIFIKHKYSIVPALSIAVAFLVLALFLPLLLKPACISWMKLALVLSWINTRIILFIIFYLILTPIGLVMKLFGADLLEKKIDKSKISYWKMKEKHDFNKADYERQF